MSDIDRVKRILRAADENSSYHRKLCESAVWFVKHLMEKLGPNVLYESLGIEWVLKQKQPYHTAVLSFRLGENGGWYDVEEVTAHDQIYAIEQLGKALAGPEGDKLIAWLESRTQEYRRLLERFEAFRSVGEPAGSQTNAVADR